MVKHETPQEVTIQYGATTLSIVFDDLFVQRGYKAIPISRHLFETEVVPMSLFHQTLKEFSHESEAGNYDAFIEQLSKGVDGKVFDRASSTIDDTEKARGQDKTQIIHLYDNIKESFDLNELRDLCFRLNVNYESLSGDNFDEKIRQMIFYLQRRNQISDLVQLGLELRPNVEWINSLNRPEDTPLIDRLYPLGTTIPIASKHNKYLLFALTWTELQGKIPDDNCNVTLLWQTLEKFWREARKIVLGEDINIPLVGSGVTGINLSPLHLLNLNVLALHNATNEVGKITSGKIRIILYPPAHSSINLTLIKQMWS